MSCPQGNGSAKSTSLREIAARLSAEANVMLRVVESETL